jgi:hypothetical protein
MFTVGIFTTHIPYIAFVLFYAYFFVAGMNRAVAGKIPTEENVHKTEIYASDSFTDSKTDTYHFFCKVSAFCESKKQENFLFERKINYPEYLNNGFVPEFYFESIFCRPPPVA